MKRFGAARVAGYRFVTNHVQPVTCNARSAFNLKPNNQSMLNHSIFSNIEPIYPKKNVFLENLDNGSGAIILIRSIRGSGGGEKV